MYYIISYTTYSYYLHSTMQYLYIYYEKLLDSRTTLFVMMIIDDSDEDSERGVMTIIIIVQSRDVESCAITSVIKKNIYIYIYIYTGQSTATSR